MLMSVFKNCSLYPLNLKNGALILHKNIIIHYSGELTCPPQKLPTNLKYGRKMGWFRICIKHLERIHHHEHIGYALSQPPNRADSRCLTYLSPCVKHLSMRKKSLDRLDTVTDSLQEHIPLSIWTTENCLSLFERENKRFYILALGYRWDWFLISLERVDGGGEMWAVN